MMDICNSLCEENSHLFQLRDHDSSVEDSNVYDLREDDSSNDDSSDDEYVTANYDLSSSEYTKDLTYPVKENKEENIIDIELYNKNRSHSVISIRESVHQCKKVLAAIIDVDFKVILSSFNHDSNEFSSPKLFAAMCLHHVSSLSYTEKLNISYILNNFPEYIGRNTTKTMNDNYFDLFFRNLDPKCCYDRISRIWHFYLDIQNALKYSLCKKLMESEGPRNEQFLCANIKNLAYLWKTDHTNRKDSSLLLSLLHYAVTSDHIEDVKFIKSIIATHMDCQELVEVVTSYIEKNCNTAKLLSLSKLIDTLDDILKADPQRKLWLLCKRLGVLLEMKHFEEFKATIIHHRQVFLSDTCDLKKLCWTKGSAIYKHAHFTVLLYILYFSLTTNQYESKAHALSKMLDIAINTTYDMKGSLDFFFSLLTQLHDGNTQYTLIFTEVLLQIWGNNIDLKLVVKQAYGAYLWKSKCFELHRKFLRYHFQYLSSTAFLSRIELATSAEWENVMFILHHITNFNEITSLNLKINKTKFRSSFIQYVSLCDESQIQCVPDTIEKVGIIWEFDQILMVHAILIYGTELIKRGCFERYKWLVIRHQSLLISKLTTHYNLREIKKIFSDQIFFLTLSNLLQHYTIFDQCTKMKRLRSAFLYYSRFGRVFKFSDYICTCDKEQFLSTSLSLRYLCQGIPNLCVKFCCLVIFWKKISESGCTDQYKDFIVDNKHLILSMKDAVLDLQFYYETEYCVLLFHLLREFILSNNNRDMNLTLSAINGLKHNKLNEFGDFQNLKPNEVDEEEKRFFRYSNWRLYRIDEVLNGSLKLHKYVRAVIDTFRFSDSKDYVSKIFTYYLQNLTTVQQEKGLIELIASVGDLLEKKRYCGNINCEILSLIFNVVHSFLVLKHEVDQAKLATFLLHLNHKCQSDLVKKVTVEVGKILQWKTLAPQSITTEEKTVIYKCFCIVRQTKKTHRLKEINLEEYTSYFDFIEMIDQEEQRQRIIKQTILLLVLLLLLTSITSDGHHKSAKLKKYLSLKYEYDDLVLYLLWCSGDVEINPGPTFSKIRSMHTSEKERKWTCEMCSVLVKLLKELPETSKPKCLWKEKPTCWPAYEPFFDPYNKSKVQNDDLLSNERLFKCLMKCCDENKICIPESYRYEINLLTTNNKTLLFETYIFRKEKHNLCEALSNLLTCKDRGKINQDTKNCGITINFDITQSSQNFKKTKRKGEIITNTRRDLAVILCKIIKGLNITEKCDGIWKTPPIKWPSDKPFYSPHNEKKRQGVCPDNELVDNLIKYCESNSVVVPSQYQGMVTAWNEGHMDELITIHTNYANIATLEHSLKYLQIEGILSKPDVLDILKKEGLTLDTDTWKLDVKKTDGNQIASRKRSQKLVVNPITSEDTAIKKSSSCDGQDTQFQKLNITKKTREDSRNTLLSYTEKTTVAADSLSQESSSMRKKPPKLSGSEEVNSQKRRLNTETFDREEHAETKKQKVNSCLSETNVPLREKKENKQLDEPVSPLLEGWTSEILGRTLNSLLNSV